MQKKTDRRVRKTKSQLRKGLAHLMKEKSIGEITVKELVDEVDIQIRSGKDRFLALLDASSSRLRPVFLAAMTTILGMIPLINDDMFGALAVTIMGGLFIGTVITLVILPVFYSLFFKIKAN